MSWSAVPPRIRAKVRALVLTRDAHRCRLQLPGCTTIATTVDHIHDRRTHGDGPDNLQAACAWCNGSKGKPGRNDPDVEQRTHW